jgi:hypothetical protein
LSFVQDFMECVSRCCLIYFYTSNNVLASNLAKFWWSSTWVDRHMLCFDRGKKRAVDVLFYFLQFFILKCNVRHLNIFIGFYTGQKDTLNGISWFFRRRRVRYSLYALTNCFISTCSYKSLYLWFGSEKSHKFSYPKKKKICLFGFLFMFESYYHTRKKKFTISVVSCFWSSLDKLLLFFFFWW